MSSASEHDAALQRVFATEQVKALSDALRGARDAVDDAREAERRELTELRAIVAKLTKRLDRLAPEGEIPPEHLAIMSAVFAAYIGKHVRIRSARQLGKHSGWAQAGRASLHQRNLPRT
ncbi:MAG: hypothetical protein IPL40_03665 [Proteobacteria bacterium]|nr:hypothetical protein [Pseudomonadota bacterium]